MLYSKSLIDLDNNNVNNINELTNGNIIYLQDNNNSRYFFVLNYAEKCIKMFEKENIKSVKRVKVEIDDQSKPLYGIICNKKLILVVESNNDKVIHLHLYEIETKVY